MPRRSAPFVFVLSFLGLRLGPRRSRPGLRRSLRTLGGLHIGSRRWRRHALSLGAGPGALPADAIEEPSGRFIGLAARAARIGARRLAVRRVLAASLVPRLGAR